MGRKKKPKAFVFVPERTGTHWIGLMGKIGLAADEPHKSRALAAEGVLQRARDNTHHSGAWRIALLKENLEDLHALVQATPASLGHWMRNEARARVLNELQDHINSRHPLEILAEASEERR
jgi:hypothetical protein